MTISSNGGSSEPPSLCTWIIIIVCLIGVLYIAAPLVSLVLMILSFVLPLLPILVVVGAVVWVLY